MGPDKEYRDGALRLTFWGNRGVIDFGSKPEDAKAKSKVIAYKQKQLDKMLDSEWVNDTLSLYPEKLLALRDLINQAIADGLVEDSQPKEKKLASKSRPESGGY